MLAAIDLHRTAQPFTTGISTMPDAHAKRLKTLLKRIPKNL